MTFSDIPLMALLKGKMAYISQRQSVIAQNVANADTPGYVPRDLREFNFEKILGSGGAGGLRPPSSSSAAASGSVEAVQEIRTNPSHLEIDPVRTKTYDSQNKEDSEVRLDGNHVVLEEQMVKLTNARMDYDAAVGFYQQSLNLLKTALKKPGS